MKGQRRSEREAKADVKELLHSCECARREHSREKGLHKPFGDFAEKQMLREHETIKRADRFLFCDTNLISGKVWADVVFKSAPEFISQNIIHTDHDLHLLCDIDLPWVADEQRRNEYNRKEIMQMHVDELKKLGLKFEVIKGSDRERLKNAISAIQKHF